ncbi:alpha-glucosidase C-terminal domain-containing protein, partial [Mesorhizobium sp. M7A.F.Ca.CA.002.03.2.1]
PWLPIPASHRARAVDVQNADTVSVLASYRAALALRGEHEALISGSIRFLDAKGDLLAFIRDGGGERLLCVFNFAGGPANWPLPGDIGAVAQLDGNAAVVETELLLPALGAFLGRLD